MVIGREYRININTPDSILSYMYVEGQDELIWNGLKITTSVNEYYVGNGAVTISCIPVKEGNIFFMYKEAPLVPNVRELGLISYLKWP